MKQSFSVSIEAITVNVAKVPVTLKGLNISAECEYNSEEMQTEASAAVQVIGELCDRFSWLKPLVEKQIQISIHNNELLSKDLEKQINEGTTRAYGPNGWSVRTSDLHDRNHEHKKK